MTEVKCPRCGGLISPHPSILNLNLCQVCGMGPFEIDRRKPVYRWDWSVENWILTSSFHYRSHRWFLMTNGTRERPMTKRLVDWIRKNYDTFLTRSKL